MKSLGIRELLRELDTDRDGKVSVDELKRLLDSEKFVCDKKVILEFIKHYDRDGDGKLDYNELVRAINS
ncbi:EF hand [Opisthorchis viverrini]|uniref:EF hand n=1 Tax=Opisthorchis viverrini TaxID=6198 RepID=A0A1S8X0D2_OPIVI|nr:EF hand [Opisthorchis viverrini]